MACGGHLGDMPPAQGRPLWDRGGGGRGVHWESGEGWGRGVARQGMEGLELLITAHLLGFLLP